MANDKAKDSLILAPFLDKERLEEILCKHLISAYFCNCNWSAWSRGTMSSNDFESVNESDAISEIADAILEAFAPKENSNDADEISPTDRPGNQDGH